MEELVLYHISCVNYKDGASAPLQEVNSYHLLTVQKGIGWVNDFLDENKPIDAPSRKRAYYACDTIKNCVGYGKSKVCEKDGPYLYKVKMTNPRKVPMSLVNSLSRKGEDNESNILIANEYWSPTKDWQYYEYLSEEMEIIEKIEIKPEYKINNTIILIGQDQDLAKKLFP